MHMMNIKEHTYVNVFYVLNQISQRCESQSTALKRTVIDKEHRHLCEYSLTLDSPLTSKGNFGDKSNVIFFHLVLFFFTRQNV